MNKRNITIKLFRALSKISTFTHNFPKNFFEGLFNMTNAMGKIKNIDKIDGKFFMIGDFYLHESDPGLRILLETTYEAIVDAGIDI